MTTRLTTLMPVCQTVIHTRNSKKPTCIGIWLVENESLHTYTHTHTMLLSCNHYYYSCGCCFEIDIGHININTHTHLPQTRTINGCVGVCVKRCLYKKKNRRRFYRGNLYKNPPQYRAYSRWWPCPLLAPLFGIFIIPIGKLRTELLPLPLYYCPANRAVVPFVVPRSTLCFCLS